MIIDPSKIAFESSKDVVDYITLGIPPTRKQFDKLMYAVRHPEDTDVYTPAIGEVVIYKQDIANWSDSVYVQNAVAEVLERVYRDRIVMRNVAIAVGAAVVVGGIIAVVNSGKSDSAN